MTPDCYFDCSACALVCQDRMLGRMVARLPVLMCGQPVRLLWINLCIWCKTLMLIVGRSAATGQLSTMCYNLSMAFIRKFKTTSGATGVQVCYKEGERVVKTVHVGSASSEKRLLKLMRKAQGIIDGDKMPLFNLDRYNKK